MYNYGMFRDRGRWEMSGGFCVRLSKLSESCPCGIRIGPSLRVFQVKYNNFSDDDEYDMI